MFFKKKKTVLKYDPEVKKPVIRSSICTGERVAGFLNRKTEKFEEIQLIRSEKDLREFKERYGIEEDLPVIY